MAVSMPQSAGNSFELGAEQEWFSHDGNEQDTPISEYVGEEITHELQIEVKERTLRSPRFTDEMKEWLGIQDIPQEPSTSLITLKHASSEFKRNWTEGE